MLALIAAALLLLTSIGVAQLGPFHLGWLGLTFLACAHFWGGWPTMFRRSPNN